MIRFERILCPTDFSRFSFRASDYAVALARRDQGEVHFLHVIPSALMHPDQYPYVPAPVRLDPEIRQRAIERLDAFVALARADSVRTRFSIEEGPPVGTILAAAEADSSSLICLGTHGREGIQRLVLGSVAEKVLRKANCPVLTVSEPRDEEAVRTAVFKNILCAVDFASLSLKAVEYCLSLAQEAGGRLTLLNSLEGSREEPDREMEAQVRERLLSIIPGEVQDWCEDEVVVRSGKPYREILAFAEERSIDLIAMGVRGRNPLDLMLFGSTTNHVVRAASCPVLTLRASERH